LRGSSPRGSRLIGYAPHRHRKTTTFVGGRLRRTTAPFVSDGAMNGPMFLFAYVKQPYHLAALFRGRSFLSVMADLHLVQTRIRRNSATCRLLVSLSPRQMLRSRAPVHHLDRRGLVRLCRNDDCRGYAVVSRLKTRVFALRTCVRWRYAAARRTRRNSALSSYKRRIPSLLLDFEAGPKQ
jgi:hypothetical protein